MRQDAVSRRTVFAGALVATLGACGCQGTRWYPHEISPDEHLLRSAIAEEETLIARYQALIRSLDEDETGFLGDCLKRHERHRAALVERLPESAETVLPTEPSRGPGPEAEPDEDVTRIGVAEQAASTNRMRQLTEVFDPALAQLLASIGACEASHAYLILGPNR
ncbi:hypothetical protein [Nocardiopsis ansamitocini]|uniref:Uncharacterized protein n=1 Tax=Nocardiopsis ansamitocini TaxID=1670832 RepID=A0A9W6P3J8_9ACTN|nr:hypothetical protein [Nocardiopsis ansamitocini]GLU46446.1 hypothetical protein Nans01_07970 [Nocardiopsis ansamitocini]